MSGLQIKLISEKQLELMFQAADLNSDFTSLENSRGETAVKGKTRMPRVGNGHGIYMQLDS